MTSPLGFKARVGSALFTIFAEVNVMYIPQDSPLVVHLPYLLAAGAQPVTSPHVTSLIQREVKWKRGAEHETSRIQYQHLKSFLEFLTSCLNMPLIDQRSKSIKIIQKIFVIRKMLTFSLSVYCWYLYLTQSFPCKNFYYNKSLFLVLQSAILAAYFLSYIFSVLFNYECGNLRHVYNWIA